MGIFELKKKCEIINERGVTRSLHVTFSVKEEPIEVFTFYCNDNPIFTGSEHQLRDRMEFLSAVFYSIAQSKAR